MKCKRKKHSRSKTIPFVDYDAFEEDSLLDHSESKLC
jgi:hypothetical protein